MALGEQIRRIRESRGLNLTGLAKRCRISKAYLSQLENGHSSRPSAEFIIRICRALGCSVEAVLGARELEPAMTGLAGVPVSLRTLAREEKLDTEAVVMLSQISYDGRQPTSVEAWRIILEAIRKSTESG